MVVLCKVKWRPSGGRGEYEFSPPESLADRSIILRLDPFGIDIPAEVYGKIDGIQGKPRLRKFDPDNRQKLHLVPLVMAIALLPEPTREDRGPPAWPLEKKGFVVSEMDFSILYSDHSCAVIRPTYVRLLHSEERVIDIYSRLKSVKDGMLISNYMPCRQHYPDLAEAVVNHNTSIIRMVNSLEIRNYANIVIELQEQYFGKSNGNLFWDSMRLYPVDLEEDIVGIEGRVLTRLHIIKERNRLLVRRAKHAFFHRHGRLFCECCGIDPLAVYGPRGHLRIHAHHRVPLQEILPNTWNTPRDLAMVCPTCHDIIHASRPWMAVEELRSHLIETGNHHFTSIDWLKVE